jgi:cell division protein FtsB
VLKIITRERTKMKTRKYLMGALSTVVLAGGISATFTSASAAGVVSSKLVTTNSIIEQEADIDRLADDMQYLFEEATNLQDGTYIMDEHLIAEKFGEENVASIAAFVKLVNGEELSEADLIGVPAPAEFKNDKKMTIQRSSWSECVGDKIIDATGIGFISGGLWKLIERKAWQQVAIELAKVVGKNAIKGGVIGFAASLAWYGIKCK